MADELDIPMPSMMPAGAATWRNVRRREGLDSSTRRLVLFAGVIGGGLLLLVGAWSLSGHRSATTIPVIEADTRPLRTKPDNPGGMQLAGQDDAILSGSSGGQDGMAPPPESPAPQALVALPQPIQPVPSAPVAEAVAPPPAAASAPAKAVEPAKTVEPAKPVAQSPPARSVALPRAVTAGPQVQLAALVTEEAATTEWQRLTRKMPDLLGGRSPAVSRLDRSDGKVFWRLRTGGFADIAAATAFCEKVRAKGGGCSLGAS